MKKTVLIVVILLFICTVAYGFGNKLIVKKALVDTRTLTVVECRTLTRADVYGLSTWTVPQRRALRRVWPHAKRFIVDAAIRRKDRARLVTIQAIIKVEFPSSRLRFRANDETIQFGQQLLSLIDYGQFGEDPNAL